MSLRSHYYSELAAGRDVSGHSGRPRPIERCAEPTIGPPKAPIDTSRWTEDECRAYAASAGIELPTPDQYEPDNPQTVDDLRDACSAYATAPCGDVATVIVTDRDGGTYAMCATHAEKFEQAKAQLLGTAPIDPRD